MNQLSPLLSISKSQARRFMLIHQRLFPPRRLKGKTGILDFIQHVGCIQFDPINVVGRNPDLVLQSRVAKYRTSWLEDLLYKDRQLLDGWDKMMSIYQVSDWPYFSRHRAYMRERHYDPSKPQIRAMPDILKSLEVSGPLSSIDFKHTERLDWSWGRSSSIAKAALDVLYSMGEVGINHKVGTRRVFNIIDRLIPAELLSASDPNERDDDYHRWHVLRRVGGLGLVNAGASENWGGIFNFKRSEQRMGVLNNLVEQGDLLPLSIDGLDGRLFFIRSVDREALERARQRSRAKPKAAIIGALDNLLWNRNLIRWVFEFDYVWEVYKPVAKRKFGYYVLPVLFGDRFIGRFEPAMERDSNAMIIKNWWWEEGVKLDESMELALSECFREFMSYLGVESLSLGDEIRVEKSLRRIISLSNELG